MRRSNTVAVVILSLGFGIGLTLARRVEAQVLPKFRQTSTENDTLTQILATKPRNTVNYEKCAHFVKSEPWAIEDLKKYLRILPDGRIEVLSPTKVILNDSENGRRTEIKLITSNRMYLFRYLVYRDESLDLEEIRREETVRNVHKNEKLERIIFDVRNGQCVVQKVLREFFPERKRYTMVDLNLCKDIHEFFKRNRKAYESALLLLNEEAMSALFKRHIPGLPEKNRSVSETLRFSALESLQQFIQRNADGPRSLAAGFRIVQRCRGWGLAPFLDDSNIWSDAATAPEAMGDE